MSETAATSQSEPAWRRWLNAIGPRAWWIGGGVAVLLVAWLAFGRARAEEPYRTAQVDRGEITRVVSATGQLEPLVSVNIGSTVSGPVQTVEVDFNSQVRAGQVLARLDPETFRQRIQQAQASLSTAQANYNVAAADYDRYARLQQEGFASPQLMAQKRAARDTAAASVSQTRAQLAAANTELERSVIRSPIDGVVVDRQVNPGQSVAASFQAPTLFVIAQDLSRLQANITVDEADIGEVRQGMPARFTVDAFPDEEFEASVTQVRQRGVEEQGVVTYTVVVAADNPGRRLLPGMTANAEIVLQQTPNVLRIPNTALRFRPSDERLQARAQELLAAPGGQRNRGGAGDAVAAIGGGQRGEGRGAGGGIRMFETLNLTEAQRAQVQQIMQSAMQGARGNGDAEPGERRAAMRRARDAAMRQIEPILTPQQRTQLAALRAQQQQNGTGGAQRQTPMRSAVVWALRNNRPEPVLVRIGTADDSFTMLAAGSLREGDLVITGGGPRAANAQQQGGGRGGAGGPGGFGGGGGGPRMRGF